MLKGFHHHTWAKVALLWLIIFSPAAPASEQNIVLLLSGENDFYQNTLNNLRSNANQSLRFTTLTLNESNRVGKTFLDAADMVITFGNRAAEFAVQQKLLSKTIFSYLTHEQYRALESGNSLAVVLLDQPLNRYLALCNALIEDARVGTLISEASGQDYFEDSDAAGGFQTIKESEAGDILGNLRDMLAEIDIFLMTPNRDLYNRNSLRGILLTTYRAGKPVISFSPSHVRSGALGSIFSSPTDIGEHLSELIEEISAGTMPDVTQPEFARYYTVTINSKVARSLGIEAPDEDGILQRLRDILEQ